MFKKNFFLVFLLFLFSNTFSQDIDLNNYTYLKSSGTIPSDFTSLFSEKYEQDRVQLSKEDKRSLRKSKEKFLIESNFIIDQILLSGRILFNDPVSNYINKVADQLLESNPDLRKQLRFYVAKSPSVNAFSTDKGIIIVNLGLIAQLENEAQLAYILSHEIIHYTKKHNMNLFLERKNIFKGKEGYKGLSLNEKYFATNYRSREMETESDKLGMEDIYLQSNYSLKVINGVFDVLQYSYLPFDDAVFDTAFFETPYLKFPHKYFLQDINPIKGDEEFDVTKSTHPSIKSRRDVMMLMIGEKSNAGKKEYILPKDDFLKVRTLARFESIHQYVLLRDYCNAIYNSYIMLKEYPGNNFLQTSIAYSLYALSEYKFKGSTSAVLPSHKNIEGQSQQVFFFLSNLKKDEMATIALHYSWQLHKQYPKDEYVSMLCEKLFNLLVIKGNKSVSDYFKKPKEEVKIDVENNIKQSDSLVQSSKYDKIKKNKAKQDLTEENYLKYAFVDLFKDPEFVEMFNKKIDQQSDKAKVKLSPKEQRIADKKEEKEDRRVRKYGQALGIDTVLLIDPFYFVFDERKADKMSYFDSENRLLDFNSRLYNNANKAGLSIVSLNPKAFKENDVDKFNDLGEINDWVIEHFNHDKTVLLPFEARNAKEVIDKYNTSHISWSGIVTVREKKKGLALYILASIFMPLYLPITIPLIVKPSYDTYYYSFLFDTKSGKEELAISAETNSNDRYDYLNSWIYYTMFQIKSKRK